MVGHVNTWIPPCPQVVVAADMEERLVYCDVCMEMRSIEDK